jgi:hypothetical protein
MTYKCPVCETEDPPFAWTDTHGIAQCHTCGTPARLFHYEDGKRIDKPAECIVDAVFVSALKVFWSEKRSRIHSGCSFPGGQELATNEECDLMWKWLADNRERFSLPSFVVDSELEV